MATRIEIGGDTSWNVNSLSIIDAPVGQDHLVQICIHEDGDPPEAGKTIRVSKAEFVRIAKMIAIPTSTTQSN